mmetsp:Transcript_36137/g.103940  ORF Transcript_36137/g.103940 Transcript_36137/m.103940 type:complete len:150 (-) Transcript_36137:81-530(-)
MPLAHHLLSTCDWSPLPGRSRHAAPLDHALLNSGFHPSLPTCRAGARSSRELVSFLEAGHDVKATAARADEETLLAESEALWVREETERAAEVARRSSVVSLVAVTLAFLTLSGEALAGFYSARDIRRKLNKVEEEVAQVAPEWREGTF